MLRNLPKKESKIDEKSNHTQEEGGKIWQKKMYDREIIIENKEIILHKKINFNSPLFSKTTLTIILGIELSFKYLSILFHICSNPS